MLKFNLTQKEKKGLGTGIFLIALLIAYYFCNYKPRQELELYGVYTDGKIINYGFGSGSRKWIVYSYSVDGVRYEDTRGVSRFRCDEEDNHSKYCKGLKIKVLYSKRKPEISEPYLGKYNKYKTHRL